MNTNDRQRGRPTGRCFPTVGHNGHLPCLPDESVAEPKFVVRSPPGQWRARPTPSTALLPVRAVFFLSYSFHTKYLTFTCCQVFSAFTKEIRSLGYPSKFRGQHWVSSPPPNPPSPCQHKPLTINIHISVWI